MLVGSSYAGAAAAAAAECAGVAGLCDSGNNVGSRDLHLSAAAATWCEQASTAVLQHAAAISSNKT